MDFSPLAIILVKNGSRGDKLLFRYPFKLTKPKSSIYGKRKNNFSLHAKLNAEVSKDLQISSRDSKGTFLDLPDEVMSHLFAVNNKLADEKFELKLNDVRFVGHPVQLQKTEYSVEKGCPITLFHVVFALKAKLPYQIIECYYELSRRISAILRYEEGRCQYIYNESQIMVNAQEEASQLPDASADSGFQLALSKSSLAQHLKDSYDQLCTEGCVDIFFRQWMHLSYCIPQRRLNCFGHYNILTAKFLDRGFQFVKSFHTILFIVDKRDLLQQLAPDSSPTLKRLIKIHSPISPIYNLAADADLTIDHVFKLALNLVLWGKATIIYPVCNTNVYVLSHRNPMTRKLIEKFAEEFPDVSYAATLAEYSLPISIADKRHPLASPQDEQLENSKLLWLLQYGLLQQFHTFVYIAPTTSCCSSFPLATRRLATVDEVPMEKAEGEPPLNGMEGDFMPSSTLSANEQITYDLTMQKLKAHLSQPEINMLMKCPHAAILDDLKQFAQLCKYFRGQHPFEEIMYWSNLNRSKLLDVLDKFSDVLITVQQPDPSVHFLNKVKC